MFNSIHFDHFFFHINNDKMNNTINIQTKIQLNVPIPNDILNDAGSDHTVIFNIESMITQTNK
jgi:hypothetical protein